MRSAGGRTPDAHGRLPALDGLRGLAILLVLVNNLYPEHPSTRFDGAVEAATNLWWVGVDLFFALSGFLITGILCDARGSRHYFRDFYARRALRIAPLYYGVLLALVTGSAVFLSDPGEGGVAFLQKQGWYWGYLVNVRMARDAPEPAPYGTGHFWSLSVEEQFYLVWPAVVLWLAPSRLAKSCVGLLALALALRMWCLASGWSAAAVYVLTPTHADSLLVGALLALAARAACWWDRATRWAQPAFLLAAPLALALIAWGHTGDPTGHTAAYTVGFTCVAIASGALLVLALDAPPGTRTARLFRHPAMRFFGQYSYGIYVFSGLVDVAMRGAVPFAAALPRVAGSQVPAATLVLVTAAGAATALAYVSYHLYEKHWLQLKRRVPGAGARTS
ncbi:acyltransferase family protein [Roseisolibacter agri]|uniref:Acyltransferase n=1 Tax=Roseisolibacter agri TaxID=2014610 RepID=A0AA37Q7S5_9BACT|nr:acyltransferase [Roseisolibacter agri]GLC28159.1 acyltransferase [Roseisolibacter agri]